MKDILVKTNLLADRTFSYFPRLNLSIALRNGGFALADVRAGEYISSIRPGMRRLVITPPE